MLISKNLIKELRDSGAYVLLDDGKDKDGKPLIALRKIQGTWGRCDPNRGGVCFAPLANGTDHVSYASVYGYNTGRRASVQALLLMEDAYVGWNSFSSADWNCLVTTATEKLLEVLPLENPRLTIEALTTPRFWYKDNWYGNFKNFINLRDAKRYARKETGVSVTIYESGTGNLVCFAPASEYCPP